MTDASTFDGTVDLTSGDVTLGGLLALFGAVGDFDVVQAVDQSTLSSEYAATEGRVGGFDANYRWEQVRE